MTKLTRTLNLVWVGMIAVLAALSWWWLLAPHVPALEWLLGL